MIKIDDMVILQACDMNDTGMVIPFDELEFKHFNVDLTEINKVYTVLYKSLCGRIKILKDRFGDLNRSNEPDYIDFNINNWVKVILTETGLKELERVHKEVFGNRKRYNKPEVDEDGYTKFQMWSLMSILGNKCYLGSKPPFDTVIKIENK